MCFGLPLATAITSWFLTNVVGVPSPLPASVTVFHVRRRGGGEDVGRGALVDLSCQGGTAREVEPHLDARVDRLEVIRDLVERLGQ